MSLLCVILLQLEVLVLGEPRREDKRDAKRKEKGSKNIERYEEGVTDVRGRRGIDCLLEVTKEWKYQREHKRQTSSNGGNSRTL